MKNILHVYKVYYPEMFGGIQKAIHDIANETCAFNFKSRVFSLSTIPNPKPFKVGCHEAITARQQLYVASTGFSYPAVGLFQRFAAEADIIHYHFPWPFMDVLHLISRTKKPTIVTYHSDIVKQSGLLQLYKPLMHRFLKNMDRIVATSPNYLQTSPVLQRYR